MRVRSTRPDVLVRDPANPRRIIGTEGANVPRNSHWMRRLAAGDVEEVLDEPAEHERAEPALEQPEPRS